MTDRHSGYVVVLESDIREDDAEHIINALRMVRRVVSVEPIQADFAVQIATARIRREASEKFSKALLEFLRGDKE